MRNALGVVRTAAGGKGAVMDWLIELGLYVVGYLFLSGEDREWSILRTSVTLGVVILLIVLGYMFLS